MKRALSVILAAGLVLTGGPGGAQVYGPNTVWGNLPQGAAAAANAVLFNQAGQQIGMVPVMDGRFAFRDLAPGQYSVVLQTAAGTAFPKSCVIDLASGAEIEVLFTCNPIVGSAPPPTSTSPPPSAAVASTGGGLGTTGWIVLGAMAAGVTTAIVLTRDDDENVASPVR